MSDNWQFKLARTFFKYRTMCNDEISDWGEIVDDNIVFCNPYLPYRTQSMSDIDLSTQLHFVFGVHNLIQDMEAARESQFVPVNFAVDVDEFYATSTHAIGSLTLTAGSAVASGATEITFSGDRIMRVQICFDLHSFMVKLRAEHVKAEIERGEAGE